MDRVREYRGSSDGRAARRRLRLTDAARTLFVERGFHATGVAQLARESGIAVGQIYRDFSSKEEIVAAIVRDDCGRFLEVQALDDAIRDGDAAQVRAWLRRVVGGEEDAESGRLFVEIVAEASRNERIAAIFRMLQETFRANVLAALTLLAPGAASAPVREVLADTVMTMSIGLLHHRLIRPDLDVPALVRSLQAIVDRRVDALIADAAAAERPEAT